MPGARLTIAERRKVMTLVTDGWKANDLIHHPSLWKGRERPPDRRTLNRLVNGMRATPDTPSGHTGSRPASNEKAAEEWLEENPPPKTVVGDLAPSVLATLKDFSLFCRRYEGRVLFACQERWIDHMLSHPYAMVLAPPRHGKTELFSVMLVVWLLCGGGHEDAYYDNQNNPLRDGQVLLVSKSEPQAKKNWLAVSNRLQLNARLIRDFGRFKDSEAIWQASTTSMVIAGRQREVLSGDYSLTVVGANSGVLGRGANTIICDDPADLKNCKRPEQAEDLMTWLRTEIFTRLEENGRFLVIGARLPLANDPYSQIEHTPYLDADAEVDPDAESDELPPLFATLTEPAVLDWSTQTLLAPEKWTWRGIMARRSFLGVQIFEAVYQQNPGAAGFLRFQENWIYGRGGHPGCLDTDRRTGQSRRVMRSGVHVPTVRVMSLDPSPTKFCGAFVMDIPQRGLYAPLLLDIRRARLPTPAMMALLRDWHREYLFRALFLEKNSADFFIQTEDFQQWRQETGVRVFFHSTGENKGHAEYGFDTLAPDVEYGRIRLPWGDMDSRHAFQPLINEMLGRLPTNDLLMALWFPKWWLPALRSMGADDSFDRYVPGGFVEPPPRLEVVVGA
jgi:hypothetical protein